MKQILVLMAFMALSCQGQSQSQSQSQTPAQSTAVGKDGKVVKTDTQWKAELTPEQYDVLRLKGTERPFTGEYNEHFEKGTYVCAACGNPLFISDSKFKSECGWPSFDKAIKGSVVFLEDNSFGMNRTEVECARCGGHLGHVFDDGPTATGDRYCTNSVSIKFVAGKK
ncbi:MAG TPA: peptide-methionine (R)-S-oxide reductase MsrB [Flavobacterium sp.]|nr:peptide-methionine (R)-S-oxide reductase MsrB [Flavobacterium sp.]